MKNLKSSTNGVSEKGYSMIRNSNGFYSYSPLSGANGSASIDLTGNIQSSISGLLHSHYNSVLSIFSGSDIRSIYQLYKISKIDDINSFIMGLVTNGTTYILKVTDLVAFEAFAKKWLDDDITFNAFEYSYANLYGIKPSNPSSSNEASFIKLLNSTNSGLKLFSGDPATFDNWNLKSVDPNGSLIVGNCN